MRTPRPGSAGPAPDTAAHARGLGAGLLTGAPSALQRELLPEMRSGRWCRRRVRARTASRAAVSLATGRPRAGGSPATLDWVTSWDVADVVLVTAQAEGADARPRLPGAWQTSPVCTVGPPLDLMAMGGTHTRPLRLDGVVVPDPAGRRGSTGPGGWARTRPHGGLEAGCLRGGAWRDRRAPPPRRAVGPTSHARARRLLVHECRTRPGGGVRGSRCRGSGSGAARRSGPNRSTWRPGPRRASSSPARGQRCDAAARRAPAAGVDVPAGAGPDGRHEAGLPRASAHAHAGGSRRTVTYGPLESTDLRPPRRLRGSCPRARRHGPPGARPERRLPVGADGRAARRP